MKSEVDLLNLETVLRAINLGIDPKSWIVPKYGVVAKNIDTLSRMSSPRDVITFILNKVPFSRSLRKALEATDSSLIASIEREIDIALVRTRKKNFAIFNLRKEALIDFFALKLAEMDDIGRILLGKMNNMPVDQIKNSLLYYYDDLKV